MAIKNLFDITKIIFEKPNEYSDISKGEKKKHFFMIQRRFAIQFPTQANMLQHLQINQVAVIDFWQAFMRKQYKRTPSWMFTKGIAKNKIIKEKKTKVSEALITEYAKKMEIDRKSVVDGLKFYPDRMSKEILQFQKMVTQK